jgi:tetratricopeptide (TPR) repeat protein
MERDQHWDSAEFHDTTNNSRAAGLFRLGLSRHQAGDLTQAEACYRELLAARPDHPDALHLLGVIAHHTGRHSAAAELIHKSIQASSQKAAFLCSLGNALQNQGKLAEAAAAHRQAALLKGALAEAYSNLGTALRDQGKLDEALAAYSQAIEIKPDYAEAHCNLAAALRYQGKLEDAITALRQAIWIRPNYAEAHSSLGVVLRDQRKLDEAVAAHREAIRIDPGRAEFYSNLGNALRDQGKLDEAIAAYRQAIRIEPRFADFHSNLGNALRDQDMVDHAVAAYNEAIRITPDRAEFHFNLGIALHQLGKFDDARAAHRQAISLRPNFVDAYNAVAIALIELGRFSESRTVLDEALAIAPRNIRCRRTLGEIVRFGAGDPHVRALEQLSEDAASLSIADRIDLHFSLGKAYDDIGRHAEAFRHWLDGNALKRRHVTYHEAATLGAMDRCHNIFTPELLQRLQNHGQPSSVPVFIVGMPRSGTTLIEQILASHPMVFGGGETKHLNQAVKNIQRRRGGAQSFPDLALTMTSDDVRDLGAYYLAEIGRKAPAATRITDKMPMNFIFAGLIHLALPNAVIIHAQRDPVDTCLSCFSKLFADNQNHTYNLAELGRYYRHYWMLMAHWRCVLPRGRILDVRYEDVVTDLEGQARHIIAHCGLEWDARCLSFHQTERPVRTSSAAQVRQPIYRRSVGRWRPYEPFLRPLLAELVHADGA